MPNYKKRRLHKGSAPPAAESLAVPSLPSQHAGVAPEEDSIESCLAEMTAPILAASSKPSAPPLSFAEDAVGSTSTISSSAAVSSSLNDKDLWDPSLGVRRPHPLSRTNRDRILTWNRAMSLWQTTGKYTTGLLPSFDVEVKRHFKVQALSTFLLESCPELKMPAFERWLIDTKLEEIQRNQASSDPVLCLVEGMASNASQRLLEEICETGMTRPNAKKLVIDLCRRTGAAHREIAQQIDLHAGGTPLKKGDRIDLEGSGKPVLTLVYHRKQWAKPFCIKLNATHYNKLQAMVQCVHEQSQSDSDQQRPPLRWIDAGKPTKLTHAFHELIMVLLLRYSSLSGGQLLLDLRGGGMQGAVHGQVFRVLAEFFPKGPLLECFGSPLNAYLPSFGSAYWDDLDWHFGSVGSFLSAAIDEGCCEANPPFSPGIMSAMTDRIDQNLARADTSRKALTFVVIVPHAGEDGDHQRAAAKRFGGTSLKRMLANEHCRLHVLLPAKEHGYVEGAQHMRPTRFKASLYATSVIILQSNKARKQVLDVELLETKIRKAFVSQHEAEVEGRRRKRDASVIRESREEDSGTEGSV